MGAVADGCCDAQVAHSRPHGFQRELTRFLGLFAAAATLCFVLGGILSAGAGYGTMRGLRGLPLALGHAHNDEAQPWPLRTALAEGFCSIEADTFVMDGQLLVGHSRHLLDPTKTLQVMYLDPLAERVARNGGRVYAAAPYARVCDSVILLVDVKDGPGTPGADASFAAVHAVLEDYQKRHPGLFQQWDADGNSTHGALTVLISGDRPDPAFVLQHTEGGARLAAIDGETVNLEGGHSPALIPTISHPWCCEPGSITSDSYHAVNPSEAQLAAARKLVAAAHQQGRRIRFWGAPDSPQVWQMMIDLDTDFVNTDDLPGFRRFIMAKLRQRPRPLLGWPLR